MHGFGCPQIQILTVYLSQYYPDSKGITKADITAISDFLEKKGLLVVGVPPFDDDGGRVFAYGRLLILSRRTLDLERALMVTLIC